MDIHRAILLTVLLVMTLSFAACSFIRATETQKNPSIIARLDSLSHGVESRGVVRIGQGVADSDAHKARAVVDEVASNIRERERTLALIRGLSGYGNSRGNANTDIVRNIEGFDADVVIGIIRQGKEKLIKGLRGEEFGGLRAYVNKFYKVPSYSTLYIVRTNNGNTLISPQSKDAIFRSAFQVIYDLGKVANEGQLSIDIFVVSEPTSADFDIWPPPNGRRRTTLTDSRLDNIYRGYYTIKVSKSGYKTIEQSLDLINSPIYRLECKLHKTSDIEGPQACKPVSAP